MWFLCNTLMKFIIRKTYVIFTVIIVLGICSMILQSCLFTINFATDSHMRDHCNVPTILWWTPFGSNDEVKSCGQARCYFTHNRTFLHHTHLKSILFYGSNLRVEDLPAWKSKYIPWGLLHEESPRNNPILVHEEALQLFTYSATFSRFSNVPLTLVDLPSLEQLLGKEHFISTKEKTKLIKKQNQAPLLYIQSDCNTASDRDSYVLELMKYIKIDSYGACVNNAKLDEKLKKNYLEILGDTEFLSFVARYKFTIAFENAVCNDYITEKLWRPLIVGSIPVYYGSPSFQDWLPNNKSAISVLDFSDPEKLAEFLLDLTNDDAKYDEYLSHKLDSENQKINPRLLDALRKRPKGASNEFGNHVEAFECYVCQRVYYNDTALPKSGLTKDHYDCPLPRNPISQQVDDKNWWVHQWTLEKCAAKLLVRYLSNNMSIDRDYFNRQKLDLYYRNEC